MKTLHACGYSADTKSSILGKLPRLDNFPRASVTTRTPKGTRQTQLYAIRPSFRRVMQFASTQYIEQTAVHTAYPGSDLLTRSSDVTGVHESLGRSEKTIVEWRLTHPYSRGDRFPCATRCIQLSSRLR